MTISARTIQALCPRLNEHVVEAHLRRLEADYLD